MDVLPGMYLLNLEERQELCDVLTKDQEWKNRYIISERAVHGEHWGSNLKWYTLEEDDLNEKFMEPINAAT